MLTFLRGKATERRLRLFIARCLYGVWEFLNEVDRQAARDADTVRGNPGGCGRGGPGIVRHCVPNKQPSSQAMYHWLQPSRGGHCTEGTGGPRSDLFGPLPFRPVPVDEAWLRWNHATVPSIARRIYDQRSYHDLPILPTPLKTPAVQSATS